MSNTPTRDKSIAQKFTVMSRTLEACDEPERVRLLKMLNDAYAPTPAPAPQGS